MNLKISKISCYITGKENITKNDDHIAENVERGGVPLAGGDLLSELLTEIVLESGVGFQPDAESEHGEPDNLLGGTKVYSGENRGLKL